MNIIIQLLIMAISKVESRADAFYIMDGSRWGRRMANAVVILR